MTGTGTVAAVCAGAAHDFSKNRLDRIELEAGLGVTGDAHSGTTVRHRYLVRRDPAQPNLRQVHLIHHELLDELSASGFQVSPGELGENVTTRGIDLLSLPTGTRMKLGQHAVVEVTGLRNPCRQLNDFRPGLMNAVLDRDADGNLIRKCGIMGIVLEGGPVCAEDPIDITLPAGAHRALDVV